MSLQSAGRESGIILRHLPSPEELARVEALEPEADKAAALAAAPVFPAGLSENGAELCRAIGVLAESLAGTALRAARSEQAADELKRQLRGLEAANAEQAEAGRVMAAQLRSISGKTLTVSDELSMELRHLSKMVSEIGDGIESQRFSLQATSEAMERIAGSVVDVSEHATAASEDAQSSKSMALTGQTEVDSAVRSIATVSAATVELKDAMQLLGDKSENIGSVMEVINEVADQTNLLALNAAIEAARAGEVGKGFAVVADEVRKLAEKTMHATSEIEGVVRDIQESAKNSILAVERTSGHAGEGAERAARAGELMGAVVQGMDRAAEGLESIAASTQEQVRSTGLTNSSLERIKEVAIDTAESMEHFTSRLVSIQDKLEELEIIAQAFGSGNLENALGEARLVEWTPDLNTGITLIDSQHKMLCAYINSLHRASKRENSENVILDVVNCLKGYTEKHFSTEEQYFKHSSYPKTEQHMQVHKNFVDKVATVEARLRLEQAKVSDDLLVFLKDWLLNHIRVTDHQYVPYVKELMHRNAVLKARQ
ncbi:bacteriohemerythrin [Desulfovibrio sp. OttesenSCG-928-C14]|nr:bacteriohemerythrin [Desulfovibrio sp. OttesenSCG-928-C14]